MNFKFQLWLPARQRVLSWYIYIFFFQVASKPDTIYTVCATSPYKYVNPLGNKFLTVPFFLQRQYFLRLCDNFKTRSLPLLISLACRDRYLDVPYFQRIIENVSKTKTYTPVVYFHQAINLAWEAILKFNSFPICANCSIVVIEILSTNSTKFALSFP